MPTFDAAQGLLEPGETGLFVLTDGRNFTLRADGSGSTGFWFVRPSRHVDRVVVCKQEFRDGRRFIDLFTARHDGVIGREDGRYTVKLLDVRLAGSTDRTWEEFADAGRNPVRYVSRPVAHARMNAPTMNTWLYHINPRRAGWKYHWNVKDPETLLDGKKWLAGKMFRQVAPGNLICIFTKNILPKPDGVYVVGTVNSVDLDGRNFDWKADKKRSARIRAVPIGKKVIRRFFGRSRGGSMQRLPPAKLADWLELLGKGQVSMSIIPPRKPDPDLDFLPGFEHDPVVRKVIEVAAVQKARRHYEKKGYSVVERGKPYDLRCKRGSTTVYVEVKGTRTKGAKKLKIFLTRNEVKFADTHRMELFVVHSITVVDGKRSPRARGGVHKRFTPWRPRPAHLEPLMYSYVVDASV